MRIYFLIAAVLIAQAAKGAWPLDFFTSDPKAALAAADKVPVPEGTDLLVLDEQLRFHVDANNRLSHSARLVYRPVTDAGVQQIREFSDTWTAWREDKPVLKARVITPAGELHFLDSATITEAGIPNQVEGLFTDTKMIAAPLPAVVKGSLIEIEMTGADRETVDPNGVAENIPVRFATAHLQVLIDLPANSPFHLGAPGIANMQRKESKDGDRRQISLEASDLRVPPALALRPADSASNPEIVFSTAPDWKEVARWYWERSEPKIGRAQPPSPGDPVSRLPEIEKILAGIQEKVRYTGIEFGLSAYVPRSPDETLSRGYGDCKDKAA